MATEARRDDGFRRLVRQARLEMQVARNQYYSAKLNQSVNYGVRHKLATALLGYHDVLWEYKTKRQDVEQAWEESDVDDIRDLANAEERVEVEAPGDTSNSRTATKPALLAVDPGHLVSLSKQLDGLAADLGFTAGVDEDRTFGKAGGEELWDDHPDADAGGED